MKVSNVMECFWCQAPLTADLTGEDNQIIFCPKCGSPNGPGAGEKFFDPIYVSEQMRRIDDNKKYLIFLKERKATKIAACGEEFELMLKLILYKKMTTDDLRTIVGHAIRIGELGQAIENYITKGGLFDGSTEEAPTKPKE